tara:strand:- start:721 stop:1080 length:360 start_codon:yes stop_codon:yes gene_type:complete
MKAATPQERLTYLNPEFHPFLDQYDKGLRVSFNKGCDVWNHGFPIAHSTVKGLGRYLDAARVVISFHIHDTEYREQDFKTYTRRLNKIVKDNGFKIAVPVTPIDVDVDDAFRFFAVIEK